jgi:hypothetical protein
LLRLLQEQGCEISRASAPFTVMMPARRRPRPGPGEGRPSDGASQQAPARQEEAKPSPREFPAGSYIVRMDQPYSRIADMMLDYQYWATNDPQRNIYDDTGWTFGELGNVQVVRVTDLKVLDAAMDKVNGPVQAAGGLKGSSSVFLLNHNADNALVTLRYRFRTASFEAAEEPFEAAGKKFHRGSFIVRGVEAAALDKAAAELGLEVWGVDAPPAVKTHPVRAPRIALMHTWQSTQNEGWWRLEFDRYQVPYDYISTQTVSRDANLRARYDVIIFSPVGRATPQAIVSGLPMFGNPLPWKTTELTPNIGKIDSTDDLRPGLGWSGLQHLQDFVRAGGLLITANDTSNFAVTFGFTPGVSTTAAQRLRVTGSALRSKMVDGASPIAYGYRDGLAIFASNPPIFGLSNLAGGGGRRPGGGSGSEARERPTGRGTADDHDLPQDRPAIEIPEPPRAEPWEALPLTDEQRRNGINVIPPAFRPRVVLRWADARELLVSGLLEAGTELAQRAAVIDVPYGQGHVVLFANNPFWRAETQGSYFLVFNAIMHFDSLDAGRKLAEK